MVHLLGIPYDSNSSFLKGPAQAPQRIRLMETEGSANAYAESGMEIMPGKQYRDAGDLNFETSDPARAFDIIKTKTAELIADNIPLLSIGGDHSVTYPIIAAFMEQYPTLHILHLDAHADLYDSFDGNPYSHASPFARIMETGKLASLTQVGIRTLNRHQREQAERFGVKLIEMKHFNLDFLASLAAPLYISLDLDVLDPAFAPGVSHHEPGGMSCRELIHIIQQISVPIVGADIVEYNPIRDHQNQTAMVGYKLLKELMAKMLE